MNYIDCRKRLSDLRVALSATKSLLTTDGGKFENDFILRSCCKKYQEEIERLEELVYNKELDNDQEVVSE